MVLSVLRVSTAKHSDQKEFPVLYKQRWTPSRIFFLLVFNLLKDSLVIGYLVTFSNIFILPNFTHLHYRSL